MFCLIRAIQGLVSCVFLGFLSNSRKRGLLQLLVLDSGPGVKISGLGKRCVKGVGRFSGLTS